MGLRACLIVALIAAGCGDGPDGEPDAGGATDAATAMDAGGGCGPSPCGACAPGTTNDDRCVDGTWQCMCVPTDAGAGSDAGGATDGGLDAGPDLDAGSTDAGATDAGPADAGSADAGPPASCMVDTDCPMGSFCRDAMGGGRECHPFSKEGESCGGFVAPWSVTRCEPGLSCVAGNPLIADAPGTCAMDVTVADLVATPATYDGRVVAVREGWLLAGPAGCTELACPMSMPCCNSCFSDEYLADTMSASGGVGLRDTSGTVFSCTGDECMPYRTCTQPPDQRYRVIGTFVAAVGYVDVQSIWPLP